MRNEKYWTKEQCLDFCKDCKTKTDVIKKSRYVYKLMLNNGWFADAEWIGKYPYKPLKWSKEKVFEECKKYKTLVELESSNPYIYRVVRQTGWIDEMIWIKRKEPVYENGYFVYIYKDDVNKVAYVGLTCDTKRRHIAHSSGDAFGKNDISPVFTYFVNELNANVPEPTYLESNISRNYALEMEDFWRHKYEDMGYRMLNKAKTGLRSGSVGGVIKWSKQKVFEISMQFDCPSAFAKAYPQPYKIARKNGWLDDMVWLVRKQTKGGTWASKDNVVEESKKYTSRSEFRTGSKGAYESARINGWLDEMEWLIPRKRPAGYWTKERIFEEYKNYKNITEYERCCSRAVAIARKNGWLDKLKELYKNGNVDN